MKSVTSKFEVNLSRFGCARPMRDSGVHHCMKSGH